MEQNVVTLMTDAAAAAYVHSRVSDELLLT